MSLYRELRPNDPVLPSEKASEFWSKVNDAPASQIIVAEYEGLVGATCMLALIANIASEGRPIGFIEHVVTAQSFRRKGLGEACLRYAVETGWKLGCCKVVLLSGVQRPEAHGVYEKVGFCGDVERGFVIKRPRP
ncbi:GNAT superfamily N-acetyltransferase [Variovorax ginsengisoli]|uniref:GNAT superfamily N-acetyltransferase n=1 Tax=Variovorax ginsengisoli TaxID=363844 RepID=A0ABT9S5R4_9BURK|nr:GNAT superfamily N-acetyltransferase [Variovorax ginsengisoli]